MARKKATERQQAPESPRQDTPPESAPAPAPAPKKSARPAKPAAKPAAKKAPAAAAPKKQPAATPAAPKKKAAPRKAPKAAAPADDAPFVPPMPLVAQTPPPPPPPPPTGPAEYCDGVHPDSFRELLHCCASEPHRLLGCHRGRHGMQEGLVIRAWHPDAERVELLVGHDGAESLPMRRLDLPGLFGIFLPGRDFPIHYRFRFLFRNQEDWVTQDPYHFLPTLGDLDIHFFNEGKHLHAYRKLGAHVRQMNGVEGVSFSLWAPNARRVSVIGEWNNWDGRLQPMRLVGNNSGIWELFIPGLRPGAGYKYEILTRDGHLRYKADPYSFGFDLRPSTHSKIVDLGKYEWQDKGYMSHLPERRYLEEPMAVYEVHLGSWMRVPEEENRWLTYRELAHALVPHVRRYGFTHIELLPICEHPFDGSWGYQVTGYFAPTSRHGTPEDFKYFVDYCHQNDIGVILDWVPAHFPRDDFALRRFDGTALYEYKDPRKGEHKDWGTLIFDYGRPQVRNFLLSSALFWLDEYHIDGLRVDAVASMLYLDYSRKPGEWVPNEYGGNENLEAISFLRQFNEVIHREFPGRFTVAEESTAFPGVSRPTYTGGLGFTFKWNMGWMHDTLRYFSRDPLFRRYHQNDLTFALLYQYSENFVLPYSHDEVVHGKKSMLGKMPGDTWQKYANLRLLFSYMYAHPGKKFLFMGAEFGQVKEWNHNTSLDWHVAGERFHKGIENCLSALGWTYRTNPELSVWDNEPRGFKWIDFTDSDNCVVSLARYGPDSHVVCVFNFTPMPRYGYRVGVPSAGKYLEIYNSDAEDYGGSNIGNYGQVWAQPQSWHGFAQSVQINIPPLGAVYLKYER